MQGFRDSLEMRKYRSGGGFGRCLGLLQGRRCLALGGLLCSCMGVLLAACLALAQRRASGMRRCTFCPTSWFLAWASLRARCCKGVALWHRNSSRVGRAQMVVFCRSTRANACMGGYWWAVAASALRSCCVSPNPGKPIVLDVAPLGPCLIPRPGVALYAVCARASGCTGNDAGARLRPPAQVLHAPLFAWVIAMGHVAANRRGGRRTCLGRGRASCWRISGASAMLFGKPLLRIAQCGPSLRHGFAQGAMAQGLALPSSLAVSQ